MRLAKPLKLTRSLIVLFISVGLLSMAIQMFVMERLNNESLQNFQEALIESRMYETASFAQVVGNDLDTFRSQIYTLYSGTPFQRLKISLNEGLITGRYIQDCQYMWSELKMRLLDNSLFSQISLYMTDSGRKVTTGSVIKTSQLEQRRIEEMTSHSNGVSLIGQNLYLWVPQFYGKQRNVKEMGCVAVGSITRNTLSRYLQQFSKDISEANLMLIYVDEYESSMVSQIRPHQYSQNLIDRVGVDHRQMNGHAVFREAGQSHLMTWAQVGNLPLVFCEVMPMVMLEGKISQYYAHLTVYRILVLMVTLGLMGMLYGIVRYPLRKLLMGLQAIEKGELDKRLPKTVISDFEYVNDQFNAMGTRIQNLVEREYTLRLLHMKAELRQLQYQINPHFLYNTYFTLRALLEEEETEQAAAFADLLGRYLKYSTAVDREYATLAEEISHAKNYAEIQQMRFSQRIDLQWEDELEHFLDLKVPKLILQPLIENAFEHGVRRMLEGGIIRVSFHDGEDVVIHVEDNGQSLTDERLEELAAHLQRNNVQAEHDSVALMNIHRRLKILFGEQSGLTVSRSELGGLKTTVTIRGEMIDV